MQGACMRRNVTCSSWVFAYTAQSADIAIPGFQAPLQSPAVWTQQSPGITELEAETLEGLMVAGAEGGAGEPFRQTLNTLSNFGEGHQSHASTIQKACMLSAAAQQLLREAYGCLANPLCLCRSISNASDFHTARNTNMS